MENSYAEGIAVGVEKAVGVAILHRWPISWPSGPVAYADGTDVWPSA
jgi:hypothetical protein